MTQCPTFKLSWLNFNFNSWIILKKYLISYRLNLRETSITDFGKIFVSTIQPCLCLLKEFSEQLKVRNNIIFHWEDCLPVPSTRSTEKTSTTSIIKFLTMRELDRQLIWFLCALVTSEDKRKNRNVIVRIQPNPPTHLQEQLSFP